MRITIKHEQFGCDCGCCGHRVYWEDDAGHVINGEFEFRHDDLEDPREFARVMTIHALGADRSHEVDWNNCEILNGDSC